MKKKLLSLFILTAFAVSNSCIFAEELTSGQEIQAANEETLIIPKKIETEINNCIVQIYGEKRAKEIYDKVMDIAQKSIASRSAELKEEDLKRADDWYKDEIIYMFYVDQFGVTTPEKPNTFKDTEEMLDYLKDLGVTTLHFLPITESPMSDAGFDVKNPQNIRQDLGGTPQFLDFVKKAKSRNCGVPPKS